MMLSKNDKSSNRKTLFFVFKGTKEKEDWLTNFSQKKVKFFGKEEVHKGFYKSLKLFIKNIAHLRFDTKDINYINDNYNIVLTGHSLGGAIATLAGCYFNDLGIKKENTTIYTFGAPPVGSVEFCKNYNNKLNLYRIVNEKDVIPKIDQLISLEHIGEKIELKSNQNEVHSCAGYIDNLIDDF